jgi:hypothetical protein
MAIVPSANKLVNYLANRFPKIYSKEPICCRIQKFENCFEKEVLCNPAIRLYTTSKNKIITEN